MLRPKQACSPLNLFLTLVLSCPYCQGKLGNRNEPFQLFFPVSNKLALNWIQLKGRHSLKMGRGQRKGETKLFFSLSPSQGLLLQYNGQLLFGSSSCSLCPLWFCLSLGDPEDNSDTLSSLQPKDGSGFLLLLIFVVPWPCPLWSSQVFYPLG